MPGSVDGFPLRVAVPGVRGAVVLLVLTLLVTACHAKRSDGPQPEASDEWTRRFPLSAAGELQLSNKNGPIDVEGTATDTIELNAVRMASAQTEAAAKEMLDRIVIHEQAASDRVVIDTEGIPGILIGVSYKVAYQVKVPASAKLRLQAANGDVTVSHVTGSVVLSTINGRLVARDLSGGVDARSVNGRLTVDLSAVGEPIRLRTTNGNVDLALPAGANANLLANTVNGGVTVDGLPFTPMGEPDGRARGRRTSGRINAGGTLIEVQTINGSVTVHLRGVMPGERP